MDLSLLTDQQIIAKTAWGEARGLGYEGMQATICTGQNRLASGVQWWGTTLREIFTHPYQYSCWLPNDPNRPKLLSVDETDQQYCIAIALAADALAGKLDDNVSMADSYHTIDLRTYPSWTKGLTPVAQIGNQVYYKTV